MIFEELESRTLFSADPVSGLLNISELLEPQLFESIPVETVLIDNESRNSSKTVDAKIRNELIFIDETVTDSDQLIKDLTSNESDTKNFTVIILDSEKNGIDQITEELLKYQGLDAVHIISHGTQGAVTLGNTELSLSNLNDYSSSISLWQNSFDEDADLLIYGCELAGNFAGKSLTTELSTLTGTDVAASVDNTGNIQLGGDWELEFSIGTIETEIAFSKKIQHSWDGLLAYQTYRDEFNTVSLTNSDGTQDWTSGGWQEIGDDDDVNAGDVTVSTVLGEQGLSIKYSGNGVLREVDLSAASNATLSFDYARINFNNANRVVVLQISGDGGGSWSELSRWQGTADDTQLQYASFDISDYIASETQIRFVTSGFTDPRDEFFIDNLQIAYASQLTTTPEFTVNQSTSNTQQTSAEDRGSTQAVAVAPNGNYVVVWSSQNQDAGGWGVFAQKYDRQGNMSGSEIQVNVDAATEASDQQWSSIAMDDNGNFVIVWSGSGPGDSDGVFYRRFNADGTAADPKEVLVNTTTAGVQDNATVAMNGNGSFVIIWEGNGDQSGNIDSNGVFGQLFDTNGSVVGGEFLVNSASGSNEGEPAVAMDDSGNFVVVWDDVSGMQGQLYNNTGTPQNGKFNIDPSNSAGEASVAMNADGDFVVAWRETVLDKGVYALRFDSLGNQKDASAILINTTIFDDQTNPSVDLDAAGNFIIVWEGVGSGDTSGVFGRKFNAEGTPVTGEFLINQTTTNTQHMASVAMLSLNDSVVVWSGEGLGDNNGVFARQLGAVIANAGSAHVINEGDSVTLNGSNSLNSDASPLTFSWDLNGDEIYGDVVGENLTVDWVILQSFGIIDNGTYTIGLQVDDGKGGVDTSTTTITVNNKAPVLSTTGSATVNQGSVYTLNLSVVDPGADTITGWTINWGDGAIDTIVGNPSTVTHTYTNSGFTYNILASATDEDGTYLQNDLLVPDYSGTSIYRFAATTGEYLEDFGTGLLEKPVAAIVGPDGSIYASGEQTGNVIRYTNDGNPPTIFIAQSEGLIDATGLAFGPDGNLYVVDYSSNTVFRYDASAAIGSRLSSFTSINPVVTSYTLNTPYGIVFGPDGDLYVNSYTENSVLRFDGATGELVVTYDEITGDVINEFVSPELGGLKAPEQMVFGPDGNLYLTSISTNNILRFEVATGIMTEFIAAGYGGLDEPAGIAFGPDGNLYISDYKDGVILRYNGETGELLDDALAAGTDEYISTGTNTAARPIFMAFVPEQQVTVTASVNNLPTITSSLTPSVNENTTFVQALTATDPESDPVSFSITGGNDSALFEINTSKELQFISAPDFETPTDAGLNNIYEVEITADDGNGGVDIQLITVSVINDNEAPTLVILSATTVNENIDTSSGYTVGTLTTTDEDAGDSKIYTINGGTDASLFTISGNNLVLTDGVLDFETQSSYDVTVRITDSGSLTHDQSFTINVNDLNEAPIFSSTAVTSATQNTLYSYTINTNDVDGDGLTISATTKPIWLSFTDNGNGTATLSGTPDNSHVGDHNVVLSVSDGNLVDTQSFTLTVSNVNDSPIITSNGATASATINVAENQTAVTTVTATDADILDTPTFSITGGVDQGLFSITSVGVLSFNSVKDFETKIDSNTDGVYEIEVTASDGNSGTDVQMILVTITDVNEAPGITSVNSQSADENQTTIATISANDPENNTLSYSLSGGADLSKFTIDTNSGLLSFSTAPDFESPTDSDMDNVYQVEVKVDDGNGGTIQQLITVNVNNVNEAPTLTSFLGTIESTIEDKQIEITFSELTDQANEGDGNGTIEAFIVKTVNSGTLSIGISADSASPWVSGTNDTIDSIYKAYWTPDQDANGTIDAFSIVAQNDQGIESTNNVIAQINISAVNDAPVINNQTFSISENSVNGALVSTVIASDADLTDSLSFSIIAGNNNNVFSINSSTGEISVTDSAQLNFETIPNFIVTVQVTDNGVGNLNDTASIEINLTDSNESPNAISLANTHIDENIDTSSGYKVGSLNTRDEDAGDTFTYNISGGEDQLNFSVGGIGNDELIITDGVLAFENQSSYEVTVRVTDSGGLSHDETFTVTINQLALPNGTTSEQNEVKTDPDLGLNELELIESSFEDSISSDLGVKTDPNQRSFASPLSTDINPQEETNTDGEEVETDEDKISSPTTQYTLLQERVEEIERVAESEYKSTLYDNHDDQYYSHKQLPVKMRIKANATSSNSLFDSKLTTVTLDENALDYLFEKSDFTDSLDLLREQVQENIEFNKIVIGSSLSVTTGLSIGYVIWLIRGGVLLSTVLSSLPAWRMIDPLPIVARLNDSLDNDEGDSLESLVKKGKEAAKSNFKLKLKSISSD